MRYPDNCAPLLPLKQNYRRGLALYDHISETITGRIACHRETCGVIAEVVCRCRGDHLEIGTLFGATLILAALARPAARFVAVDPMTGYYGRPDDPVTGICPTTEVFCQNARAFGVDARIELVKEYSHPWPLSNRPFDTCLIDGDHSVEAALRDWLNVKHRVKRYVIFDNVDDQHPGVVTAFRAACASKNWRPVLVHDICGVVERCDG